MNVEPGSKGVPDNITTSKLAKKAAAVVVEVKEKEKEKEKEKGSDDREKLKPKAPSKQKPQDKDMPRWNQKEKEDRIQSVKEYYQITGELGQGSFGAVYAVTRRSDKQHLAMKVESVNVKKSMLAHEAEVLLSLSVVKSAHFVILYDKGSVENRFLFLVQTLVGINLWDLRTRMPEKRYTLAATLRIAEQTLAGLADMHRAGFLHRDIKPPNFAIGRAEDNTLHTVYILDFGLCRRIARKGSDLRMPRKECGFRGTTRYASLAAHDGREQSRKDDIESWWYMIAEMIVVDIPWKQFKGTEREDVRRAKQRLRDDTMFFKLVFRKGCSEQMLPILEYLDCLDYSGIPDYDWVYRHIKKACLSNNITRKTPVDWDPGNNYNGPRYKMKQAYISKSLVTL